LTTAIEATSRSRRGQVSPRPIANTHVHLPPNFSAFATVTEAVERAASEGVLIMGASNYHHFGVYPAFAAAAEREGISALFGLEVVALQEDLQRNGTLANDPDNPGRTYLCGKGIARFERPSPVASALLADMRAASDQRIGEMSNRLAAVFAAAGLATDCTVGVIAAEEGAKAGVPAAWVALQERHVARAFQEALFRELPPDDRTGFLSRLFGAPPTAPPTGAVAVQEEIRTRLMKAGRPAFVPDAEVSFGDAWRLVVELGGIPCYPTLADGASPICSFEDPPAALADRLLSRGVYCAELIPGRNRGRVVDRYVAAFRRAGVLVMAGTEHNTQRMIPLEPACLGGEPLSELAREAFWEGACVAVAHQHLVASGQPGYVDGDGRLNEAFADDSARIDAFRELGAELIGARSGASPRS
jgi:hypothetical protein